MNKEVEYNPSGLLDAVISKHGLKNDAALSRMFEIAPPLVSKVRNKRMPVGSTLILKCIEIGGMTAPEVRAYIGGRA